MSLNTKIKCKNCNLAIMMHMEHRYWFHDGTRRRTCADGFGYAEEKNLQEN